MNDSAAAAYRRPYLLVDGVDREDDNRILLRRGARILELEIDGEADAAETWLRALRDPDSESWSSINKGSPQVVQMLDHEGWLADAGSTTAERDHDSLGRAVTWLQAAIAHSDDAQLSRRILELARDDARMLVAQLDRGILAADWPRADQLAMRALLIQLRCWQRTAPEALRMISVAFDHALQGGRGMAAETWVAPWMGAQPELLWQACSLLFTALVELGSTHDGGDRPVAGGAAINTLVEAENRVRALLETIGHGPIETVLQNKAFTEDFGRSVFLHQHRVTERFVESILPLMRRRLNPRFRRLVYRYFDEELGHEEHEKAICRRLGLSDPVIDAFVPLPYFGAYVDMLGYAAEVDPLTFLLSLCAAEGLPGTRKPLPDLLVEAGLTDLPLSDHTDIDEALNHSVYSRRLFGELDPVSTVQANCALERFVDIVELSQRAWHQAANAVQAGIGLDAAPFEVDVRSLRVALARERLDP
jgi:hypothetical protein